MQFQGQILKMTSFHDEPIQYYLNLSGDLIHMNELFGKELTIKHTGYQCVNCGENKPIYRSKSRGYEKYTDSYKMDRSGCYICAADCENGKPI